MYQVFRSTGNVTLESEGSNKLFLLKNDFIKKYGVEKVQSVIIYHLLQTRE